MKIYAGDMRGMTLVEGLVAGVIGVVIAGVTLVVYRMYNDQARESSAGLALQMQYALVAEQVAAYSHRAHRIFGSNESYLDACQGGPCAFQSVFFYDNRGVPFAGIGCSNDTLIECNDSLNWRPFEAGSTVVLVDMSTNFRLNGCRNAIELNLRLKRPAGDTAFYIGPAYEVFACRN